jgi:sugar/nucleoside kinase (ribokinase family)
VSPSLDDLTSALRLDDDYSPELVDDLADRMLAQGAAVVAISAGRHGLRLRTASASRLRSGGVVLAPLADEWADAAVTVGATPVEDAVTTNGAGDASTAGLLFALTLGASPHEATALAAACSAAIMGGRRATPAQIVSIDPSLTRLVGA